METTLQDATATSASEDERRDALAGRLFGAATEALDLFSVYLGDQLGLYAALVELGEATPGQLAAAARCDARYVREWLEHQAITEIVHVATPSEDDEARTYRLPPGHAEALLDQTSLACVGPLARALVAVGPVMPQLEAAFRSGEGIAFGDYGHDLMHAQAGLNRPLFEALLTTTFLPALPDLDARLREAPGARVLDVGCGTAWSSIAIARGYDGVTVDALDSDAASIDQARANVAAAGLEDRVRLVAADSTRPPAGPYALVTILEALHDLPHPIATLAAARAVLEPGGAVLVMDERVEDAFGAIGDPVERFMYGVSVVHCLPVGRTQEGSAATGTVMRTPILRRYAEQAGFASLDVLDIDHPMYRFYRLNP